MSKAKTCGNCGWGKLGDRYNSSHNVKCNFPIKLPFWVTEKMCCWLNGNYDGQSCKCWKPKGGK